MTPNAEFRALAVEHRGMEKELLSYKRFDPFMSHARLLVKFFDQKAWKTLGFSKKMDWLRSRYPESYVQAYVLVNIAKRLTPFLSDEDIQKIGISKCDELARLVGKRKLLEKDDILKARTLGYKDFEKYIEGRIFGGQNKQEYGEYWPSAFRGLQHAPTNELGVVYLFGVVSAELGFIVELIKPGFPDCIGKRRKPGKREIWLPVKIEFEYRSKNYNHPEDKADLIVCWEHDWKGCPIDVLELRTAIKELPNQIGTPVEPSN